MCDGLQDVEEVPLLLGDKRATHSQQSGQKAELQPFSQS